MREERTGAAMDFLGKKRADLGPNKQQKRAEISGQIDGSRSKTPADVIQRKTQHVGPKATAAKVSKAAPGCVQLKNSFQALNEVVEGVNNPPKDASSVAEVQVSSKAHDQISQVSEAPQLEDLHQTEPIKDRHEQPRNEACRGASDTCGQQAKDGSTQAPQLTRQQENKTREV